MKDWTAVPGSPDPTRAALRFGESDWFVIPTLTGWQAADARTGWIGTAQPTREAACERAGREMLCRVARSRIEAARRGLDTARLDPHCPDSRIAFLRGALTQAQRALLDLEDPTGLAIPPAPADGAERHG